MSILNATHRESVRSVVGVHVGIAAEEAEVARIGAANRTAPIVAVGTDLEERTITAAASARHGQFKRRGKSADACVSTPTCTFSFPFGFCRKAVTGWARVVHSIYALPEVVVLRAAPIVRGGDSGYKITIPGRVAAA